MSRSCRHHRTLICPVHIRLWHPDCIVFLARRKQSVVVRVANEDMIVNRPEIDSKSKSDSDPYLWQSTVEPSSNALKIWINLDFLLLFFDKLNASWYRSSVVTHLSSGRKRERARWAPTKHDFWSGYTPIVVVDPRWSCPDLLTSFCFRQCGVDGQRNSSKLLQLPQTSAECWHGSPSLLPLSLTALLGPCTLSCHSLYCIPYFLKSRLAWRWFGFCAYYSEKGCIQMERLPKQRSEECTNG